MVLARYLQLFNKVAQHLASCLLLACPYIISISRYYYYYLSSSLLPIIPYYYASCTKQALLTKGLTLNSLDLSSPCYLYSKTQSQSPKKAHLYSSTNNILYLNFNNDIGLDKEESLDKEQDKDKEEQGLSSNSKLQLEPCQSSTTNISIIDISKGNKSKAPYTLVKACKLLIKPTIKPIIDSNKDNNNKDNLDYILSSIIIEAATITTNYINISTIKDQTTINSNKAFSYLVIEQITYT